MLFWKRMFHLRNEKTEMKLFQNHELLYLWCCLLIITRPTKIVGLFCALISFTHTGPYPIGTTEDVGTLKIT